ncbi:helix-turn-helix transcriptional regulator [Romboutsia sp.]|uniref:helix-turn-helix transcriptional regulator n=1 Tax=Romboutsia sp. TaxID=1965302 RepID=UPI003F3738D3
MNKVNNNIKFYTFIDILSTYSDENTSISIKEINHHMNNRIGVTLDRRTVYSYTKDMRTLGLDVSTYNEETGGYHFINHSLEEHEIRILVDAISASKFITKKKTVELVDKLSRLNSIYIKNDLNSQVFVDDRSKSINEEIFINIDKINTAIRNKKKISFYYYDYNSSMNLVPRLNKENESKRYTVTPIATILKNENYYLVLADKRHNDLSNYRVDRMKGIEVVDTGARILDEIEDCKGGFNPAVYSKKSFKMFPGEESRVEIRFERNLLNFMIDEFGCDIEIIDNEDGSFNGRFVAKIGKGLARWIFQLGKDAVVVSPEKLKNAVKCELKDILVRY